MFLNKRYLPVLLFLFFVLNKFNASAQSSITIFSDITNDSLKITVKLLSDELQKAGVNVSLDECSKFDGKGIVLDYCSEVKNKTIRNMGPEAIIVKSTAGSVYISGNSANAIEHGIFIYLEKLGFRYFLPHPDWHIIPMRPNLYPYINYKGEPSFLHRRIWYSYGTGSKSATADYNLWFKANRLGTSIYADFGHAYDNIVYRNQETFKKHPEWFFPKLKNPNIIPPDPKFNLADESLVQFLIQDVFKVIEERKNKKSPAYRVISMMPSDGLGTCNTPECMKLGKTITDRVFYLVNRVAKAVRQKYPDVWIGGMSYGEYAGPPTKKLEPNTIVNIATAFNSSGYNLEQLIKLWSEKAGKTGLYDYLSLYNWDWDMPGQSQASRANNYTDLLRKYYGLGIRSFEAETNVGISKGLGHYLIARLLWNINDDTKKSEEEFYNLCFGNIAGEMKTLWKEWESYPFKTVREKDLARWIDEVTTTEKKVTDSKVKKRLFHVKSYLYYISLYNDFINDKSEAKRIALLTYANRMLDYACFAGYPALFDLGNGTGIPGFSFNDPNAKYRQNKNQITENEIVQNLFVARKRMKLITGLTKFDFTKDFKIAPGADKWKGWLGDGSNDQNAYWMGADFVMKISKQGAANYIDFVGGFSTTVYEKPITVTIYPYNSTGKPSGTALLKYDYNGVRTVEKISLAALKPGNYIVHIEDPAEIFKPKFSPAIAYSLIVTPQQQLKGTYGNHLFIYVPSGVKKFTVLKYEAKFQTPTGRVVDLANKVVEEAEIEVKPGEEGLWKMTFFSGELYFEGLPPVMGPVADRMLIPDNVK